MEVNWSSREAATLDELGLLVYRSRLLGSDSDLVNRGGGNTSSKRTVADFRGRPVRVLTVKGTGADLAGIGAGGFVDLRLDDLQALREQPAMSDDEMVAYLAHCQLEPDAPRASIETTLHGFLPYTHIDHTHCVAALGIGTCDRGPEVLRDIFGDEAAWVPYVRPGFALGKLAADAVERLAKPRFAVLAKHGLATWAEDPQTCYEQTLEFRRRCDAYLAERAKGRSFPSAAVPADGLAEAVLPTIRAALTYETGPAVLHLDASPEALVFAGSAEGRALAAAGLACPDHVLATKVVPLVVDAPADADTDTLVAAVQAGAAAYREAYHARLAAHGVTEADSLGADPKVVVVPGLGVVTAGRDKAAAQTAANDYRRSIRIAETATLLGGFTPLTEQEAFDIEYWPLELYKLTLRPKERELSRRVALVTGAAGAIGRSLSQALAAAGAQVVIADLNLEGAEAFAAELCEQYGPGAALPVAMNVTDEASVQAAFAAAVRTYGGMDIVVCNAGIAFSHPIEETPLAAWQRTLDVLTTGYFITAREGIRVMRQQRRADGSTLGGSVIFVASKAGLAAAKNAAAYATSKAAVLHLARCLVEEVSADGIRVNSLAPDAIITGSGLWAGQWGQARAASHGVDPTKLADFYQGRNLLKTVVTAEDVAEAALFLASERAKVITGAVLTVDGGLHDGYVR